MERRSRYGTRRLGAIHRQVCLAQHCVRVGLGRQHGHADRETDRRCRGILDLQPVADLLHAGGDRLGIDVLRDHDEFVAGIAHDAVAMAEADLQGSFSLTNRDDGGTLALVTIPKGGTGRC